jgi:hypothetical protein
MKRYAPFCRAPRDVAITLPAALLMPAMRAAPPAPLRAVSFADIFFAIITIDHYYRRCLIRRFDFAIRYAD